MYKIKPNFFEYVAMIGVNLKELRFKVCISDVSWKKLIKRKGFFAKNSLKKLYVGFNYYDNSYTFDSFVDMFIEAQIVENSKKTYTDDLRQRVKQLMVETDSFNITNLSQYIGVSKQYVSNFLLGQSVSELKAQQVEKFLELIKNRI